MDDKITFDDLIKKEEEFSEEHEKLIAPVIKKFISIITPSGSIEFNNQFHQLTGARKVVTYSLIKKGLFHRKLGNYKSESVKPNELSNRKDLKISLAVAKKVFNRELSKFFDKNKEGYFIPTYKINLAIEYLKDG